MKNEEKQPKTAKNSSFHEFLAVMAKTQAAKNHDYAAGNADHDPHYNFTEIAKMLDGAPITPYTVALIYFMKHVFSVVTFAKTAKQESGESLSGRHIDLAVYSSILNDLKSQHIEWVNSQSSKGQDHVCLCDPGGARVVEKSTSADTIDRLI
jgi:hypothetical protein